MNVSSSGGNSQDFELNLASIIDCLTVLITFLLASASFVSIGVLDAGIAAPTSQADTEKPPEVQLTIEIARDRTIQIKVEGKTNQTMHAPAAVDDKSNILASTIHDVKVKYPSLQTATLSAANDIAYEDIIKTLELVRKEIPGVILGGF